MHLNDRANRLAGIRLSGFALLLSGLVGACSSGDSGPAEAIATADEPPATENAVTGTLGYRERMLLRPGSVAEIWLLDTSLADAAATEIAYQRIENVGQQPVPYRLEYDPADIREGMQYSVRATISRNGEMLFTTDRHYGVLTRGAGNTADLELIRVGPKPTATESTEKPDASLTNTYWKLTSIGGTPYRHEGEQREPHLKLVTQDLVASGRTGCNAFTGSYEHHGESLRFGNMAVTMMACVDGMDTERAFLDALEAVDRFAIAGDTLALYAGDELLLGFDAIYF